MASVGPNVASSPEYAGTFQSLQLLVVRGVIDTDTAYLSNIRALPIPRDSASTYGTKGNLQYTPAILVHHVFGDITTYFSDLPPKFHPSYRWQRRPSSASLGRFCRSSAGWIWSARASPTPRS